MAICVKESLYMRYKVHILLHLTLFLFLFLLQQYFAALSERSVAYINVDIAVFGKKLHTAPAHQK